MRKLLRNLVRGGTDHVASAAGVLLVLAAFVPSGWTQEFSSPKAALESLYASYMGDEEPDARRYFSDRLGKLYDADLAKGTDGEGGALDFDPVIGGQDYELKDLVVGDPSIRGDTADVEVRFRNSDLPTTLEYTLKHEAGGWKIDDIESRDPDNPWTLTKILAGDRSGVRE